MSDTTDTSAEAVKRLIAETNGIPAFAPLNATLRALLIERDRLREAVQWFIDNDETNQGDEPMPEFGGQSWNEINAYWVDGLNRARAALKETGHE
jgi:hypothetical protein